MSNEYIETICVENMGYYEDMPVGYAGMIFGNVNTIPAGLKAIVGLDLLFLKNKRSPA